MDESARLFVSVRLMPDFVVKRLVTHLNHLFDWKAVFIGKGKVTLVVRRHAHDRAITIAHQYVVADPDGHGFTSQWMGDNKTRIEALFFACRELGFCGAALFALFDKASQSGVGECGMLRKRVLRRHGAKRHTHDGIGAGGKDVHLAVLN